MTEEEEEELEFVCCVCGAFWQSGASLHHLQ
jgi:hypothetical protein